MKEGNKPIEIYSELDSFIFARKDYQLKIDKKTHDNSILENYNAKTNPIYCYGIVGSLEAKKQKYLVYIDEVDKKGEYLESVHMFLEWELFRFLFEYNLYNHLYLYQFLFESLYYGVIF